MKNMCVMQMVKYKEKPGEKNPENRESKGWQFSFVSHRDVFKKSYKYQKEIKRAFSPAKPRDGSSIASSLQRAFLKSDIIVLIIENVHLL